MTGAIIVFIAVLVLVAIYLALVHAWLKGSDK